MQSAAQGALLGACIGDAAGAVLEFLGRKPTKRDVDAALTLPGGGKHKVAPGQITDDSELSISLASALVQNGSVWNVDTIAEHYAKWIESKPFDCGEATQLSMGCFAMDDYASVASKNGLAAAMTLAAAKLNNKSQSNGSMMRAIPLAVWGHALPESMLVDCVLQEARLTHSDPTCVDATVCYVLAVAHLITHQGDRLGAFARAKSWVLACGSASMPLLIEWLEEAETGTVAPYGPASQQGWVRIAFSHAFRHLYHGTSFIEALKETLAGGGDTDTNAAIVCGVLGAVCGQEGLPQSMLSGVLGADTTVGRPRPAHLHPLAYLDLTDKLLACAPHTLSTPTTSAGTGTGAPPPPLTRAISVSSSWCLVPSDDTADSAIINLSLSGQSSASFVIGRNVQSNLADKRLSRKHLEILLPAHGDSTVQVVLHGTNASQIRRNGQDAWEPLQRGVPTTLQVDDEVSLIAGAFSFRLMKQVTTVPDHDASDGNDVKNSNNTAEKKRTRSDADAAAAGASTPGGSGVAVSSSTTTQPPAAKRAKSSEAIDGDAPHTTTNTAATTTAAATAPKIGRSVTGLLMAEHHVKESDLERIQEILPATPNRLAVRALIQANQSVEAAIELILTNSVAAHASGSSGSLEVGGHDAAAVTSKASAASDSTSQKASGTSSSTSSSPATIAAATTAARQVEDKRNSLRALIAELQESIAGSGPVASAASTATDAIIAKLQLTLDNLEQERQKAEAEALAQQQVIQLLVSEKEELIKDLSTANKSKMQAEEEDRLYMPGEKEVRHGNTMRIYNLYPRRQFSTDAGATHFRTAESQFHRLFKNGSKANVVKVEYVVNPKHVRAFEKKRLELATHMDWDECRPILAFHGTAEKNISSIIKHNFSIAKVGSATDAGWYGAGCYFSEDPSLSMGYTRGATKFLLCQILLGRVYKCPGMCTGSPLKDGYDSHQSPCGKELVIFDPAQILPIYVVHYSVGGVGLGAGGFVGGFGFGFGAKKGKGAAAVVAAAGVDYYHDIEIYHDEPLDADDDDDDIYE